MRRTGIAGVLLAALQFFPASKLEFALASTPSSPSSPQHQHQHQQQQQQPSSVRVPISALRIARSGETSLVEVSRASLASQLGCPLRDLRIVDPRKRATVVSLGNIKAVITAEDVLFSATDGDVVEDIVRRMTTQSQSPYYANEPFERMAMEVCLKKLCFDKSQELAELVPCLRSVLGELKMGGASLSRGLDELLPLKNSLDELHSTVEDVCNCLSNLISNEEDMNQMYLTAPGRSHVNEHEEIEILFENYYLQLKLMESDIREYQEEVKNTEEIVEIQLDVLRNRILRVELMLSISSFMVTAGALLTGVFGMNLLSHLEEHRYMFWIVSTSIYSSLGVPPSRATLIKGMNFKVYQSVFGDNGGT